MAGSAAIPDQPFHVRSISLPSRLHPIAAKVEEELRKLKAVATSSSSSTEEICNGLGGVGDLYNSVDEVLRLPSFQQTVFGPHQKKRLEEELEVSVMLLDLVDNMKDLMVAMKEHVQDLRLALRRRGNKITQDKEQHRHLRIRKEMQKNVNKCYKALKQMDEKCGSFVSLDRDSDLSMVIRIVIESRDITLSVLGSALHLLSMPWQKQKGRRWSIVSKAIQKRKVACEDTRQKASGFDFCYSYQCTLNKDANDERILQAQDQLNAAEVTIEALETGLQSLLRRLIQCRVSFLNILSLN